MLSRILTIAAVLAGLALYWQAVHAEEAETLSPGWNLIVGTNQTPEGYIADHPCARVIYAEYQETWYHHFADWPAWRNRAFNGIAVMPAGYGMWVFCDPDYSQRLYLPGLASDQ